MARKPTYAELEQRVKELERQLADTGVGFFLKDYTSYQSVLAELRGIGPEEDEESLLNTFLSEIVKQFGFAMAWYGRYGNDTINHFSLPGAWMSISTIWFSRFKSQVHLMRFVP